MSLPMNLKEKFDQATAALANAREQHQKAGKDWFKEGATELFAKHPAMQSFAWRQYTPYFNDGDPCTFRVIKEEVSINDGDETNGMGRTGQRCVPGKSPDAKAACDVVKFLKGFSTELFEAIFGDHVTVKVTRDEVTTEEYDHD